MLCDGCQAIAHRKEPCMRYPQKLFCTYCIQKERISIERQGVKRKQEKQAEHMLKNSARRYSPANIGDSVRVYLSEVDRGRCEFPNILAIVIDITPEGMFKLGTKEGILKSHYARNQFEVLPNKHLSIEQVDQSQERPLRTVANEQSAWKSFQ